MPLDLVVIMLGTNDLKPWLCGHALGAAAGMRRLAQIVRTFPYEKPGIGVPQVMLVAPPFCSETADGGPAGGRSIAESKALAPQYKAVADEIGAAFFDAGTVAKVSPIDGVHLVASETEALGKALVEPVRALLG